jgi:uncharacterized protein
MKRLARILSLILFFPVLALSLEKPQNQKPDRSLLWKITGGGMKYPSYVFGTIHMLCQKDYLWTAAMKKSLRSCKEVCFELDMDDPTVMMQVAMGMVDNSGRKLKDYFSPEDYAIVEKFVKDSLRLNIDQFQQMKPAVLQSMFATKALNCKSPVSYETNIMSEAKALKMQVTGLEEPSEQLELFNGMVEDSVVKELVAMAKDYSKERNEYQKMLKAYKQQDLALLYQIIEEGKVAGGTTEQFLDERNEKWIDRMQERMEQKPVFFAVGAGHLWGDKGIIQLLKNTGYTLEPVR